MAKNLTIQINDNCFSILEGVVVVINGILDFGLACELHEMLLGDMDA